jgi:hypothetical protein
MAKSGKKNQPTKNTKPSVGQSITIYGGFIYKTLEYFGVTGKDLIEWLETLPPKLPEIWRLIQHLI